MTDGSNRRVLLIDDTPSIHEDFRKILTSKGTESKEALADAKTAFFGEQEEPSASSTLNFELDAAFQGQEGLEMLLAAIRDERPYALAFVDVRMPPGWDGIQTIKQLWRVDPELQVVICTAYSDYSWDQTIAELGHSDNLLILKKPFDSVEIRQLASALTDKWNAARRARALIGDLRSAEAEARAYASSLETMNRALTTVQATSEKSSAIKSEFLVNLSSQVNENLTAILDSLAYDDGNIEGLEGVLDASRSLVRTLDRILDLDQVEAGAVTLEPRRCALVELTRGVLDQVRPATEDKDLELEFEMLTDVPEVVQCDAERLENILWAIVENAVQHTERGSVKASLAVEPGNDWQHSRARIQVEDTGAGVPAELEGRLYDPFVRQGTESAGLGLALARGLARLMRGDVTHEEGRDGGAVFLVEVEVENVSGARMLQP